ncbi:AraC family transcriptional regulator, partial [Pseudomonas aeruginosa]
MLGSATGHYQARTVRPSMQYFDCDLSFTEPLRTHKVLPEGLCIVQMFDGQWRHSVDGGEPYLYNLGGPSVLGTGEPMEAFDILPAGSRVRLGGLRIAASYLEEELETGDGALRPLARLKGDGASFTQLSRCGAITALFERLYQNPYRGALGRLHEESLTLGLLVELAAY